VIVDNSPCLQEMRLLSTELLALLQRRFPDIASLRFTLGTVRPGPEPTVSRIRSEVQQSPSHEELRVIEAMATSLPDPILGSCLRRLLTKDLLARRSRDSRRRPEERRPAEGEDS